MSVGLTARQAMCLDFIESHTRARGFPPTIREIGAHMGIRSTNGVSDHLRALERKGVLSREMAISRSLRVRRPDGASADMPEAPAPPIGRLWHVAKLAWLLTVKDDPSQRLPLIRAVASLYAEDDAFRASVTP